MRLFTDFKSPFELPWTYSFVIRKLQQVDSFNELPKEKRPPDKIVWWGTSEELEDWMDKVFPSKSKKKPTDVEIIIEDDDIENYA